MEHKPLQTCEHCLYTINTDNQKYVKDHDEIGELYFHEYCWKELTCEGYVKTLYEQEQDFIKYKQTVRRVASAIIGAGLLILSLIAHFAHG